jgi:cytidine deaminase
VVKELVNAALAAKGNSHAPYSAFKVGAALLAESGLIFVGCNVENISFGLTLCAERVCIGSAVAAGETKFRAIALATDSKQSIVPCGACRQVLAEFNPNLEIFSFAQQAKQEVRFRLGELLPLPRQGILG